MDVADSEIVKAVVGADAAGIDCPLGWPEAFVDMVNAHREGSVPLPAGSASWRQGLRYRRTDLAVQEATGLWPLSVSTDRIGVAAMRAAALLARLDAAGSHVERAGGGPVVEVYPAAALRLWGLPATKYKRAPNQAGLDALVTLLARAAPWLSLGEHEALCRQSDDAFDAVVASLVARASALGLGSSPSPDAHDTATREGWIVLPQGPLSALSGE